MERFLAILANRENAVQELCELFKQSYTGDDAQLLTNGADLWETLARIIQNADFGAISGGWPKEGQSKVCHTRGL